MFTISYLKIRIFDRDLPPKMAGQEREAETQPVPFANGIFDTHTQVCRGLVTRAQRRYRAKRLF
jgi:hypothetical protein